MKKILALILALCMSLFLLAGCGKSATVDLSEPGGAGSVELEFSEMIALVESDQVEEIELESDKYTVVLKEECEADWLSEYYGEEYTEELQMPELYTAPLNYDGFLELLHDHGVGFYTPYTPMD